MPICWAVFKLIPKSNFVGSTRVRSAGFLPLNNLVHVFSSEPVQVSQVDAVT